MFAFQQRHSPLHRGVTLDELGGAGLYLLSDLSTGVTGEIHFVDSGYNVIAMPHPDALRADRQRKGVSRAYTFRHVRHDLGAEERKRTERLGQRHAAEGRGSWRMVDTGLGNLHSISARADYCGVPAMTRPCLRASS